MNPYHEKLNVLDALADDMDHNDPVNGWHCVAL